MEAGVDTRSELITGDLLDDEDAVNKIFACRGCLETNNKLYNLYENNLYEAFEDIVGHPVFEEDDMPQYLCLFCASLVHKFIQFRDRCRKTQDLLDETILSGKDITMNYLKSVKRNKLKLKLDRTNVIHTDNVDRIDNEDIFTHTVDESALRKFIEEADSFIFDDDQDNRSDDGRVVKDSGSETDDDGLVDATDMFFKNILPMVISSGTLENVDEKKDEAEEESNSKKKKKKAKLPEAENAIRFGEKYNMMVAELTLQQQLDEVERMKAVSEKRAGVTCQLCGKNNSSEKTLENHMHISHNPLFKLECPICRVRKRAKYDMDTHMEQHKFKFSCKECRHTTKVREIAKKHHDEHKGGGTNYACQFCDQIFASFNVCVSHVRMQHIKQLSMCRFCGDSFMGEFGANMHEKRVHRDLVSDRNECPKCNTKFITAEALRNHESGSSESCCEYTCVHCGDSFEAWELLRHHVIQHNARGSLSSTTCQNCNIRFTYTRALALHTQNGCSNRNCTCVHCGWAGEESQLAEHVQTHDGDHFRCNNCDREYRLLNALLAHYKSCMRTPLAADSPVRIPPGIGPFKGVLPDRQEKVWGVSSIGAPAPVKEDVEPARYVCHICAAGYKKQGALNKHVATHGAPRFTCDVCQKPYVSRFKLIQHMRLHTGEKPFKCQHCPKAFRVRSMYNRHVTVHTGLRRHICQLCNHTFKTSTCVKTHIKTVHMKIKGKPRIRNKKPKDTIPVVYPTNERYPTGQSYLTEKHEVEETRFEIAGDEYEEKYEEQVVDDRHFEIIGTNVAKKRPKLMYQDQTLSYSGTTQIKIEKRKAKKIKHERTPSYQEENPSKSKKRLSSPKVKNYGEGQSHSLAYGLPSSYDPSDDDNVRPLGPPRGKRPIKVFKGTIKHEEPNALLEGIPEGYIEEDIRLSKGGKYKPGYYFNNMPELD